MRNEEPLLFIKSPVIRKFMCTPTVEEESTSVFEMEHTREAERVIELPQLVVSDEEVSVEVNPYIQKNLDYLVHPFRKELYQPIEIVTEERVVKGILEELKDDVLWMKEGEDLTSITIHDIRDIKWKQQSFSI
ncbi:hypothetical protein ABZ756_07385 [Mammaliicoccus sciuri]